MTHRNGSDTSIKSTKIDDSTAFWNFFGRKVCGKVSGEVSPGKSKNQRFVETKRSKSLVRALKMLIKYVCSDASKSTKMDDSIAFWPFLGRQIWGAKIVKKSSQRHDIHNSESMKSTKIDDSIAFLHLFDRTVSGALGALSF